MQLKSVDVAAESVLREVSHKSANLIRSVNSLEEKLDQSIDEWKKTSQRVIEEETPYQESDEKLLKWEHRQQEGFSVDNMSQMVADYRSFCQSAGEPFDQKFWAGQLKNNTPLSAEVLDEEDLNVSCTLLLNDWRKKLDRVNSAWQLKKLDELRTVLIKEIEEWLKYLSTLVEALESLGLDPGVWLDLSSGALNPQAIDEFRRWAKYLSEDKSAREIADLLGKMRQIESSEQIEKVSLSVEVAMPVIDVSSKEEIVGVRLGRDIEHALPSELALLSDPETSLLFDLKYLESRLLCFEMQGEMLISEQQEVEIEQSTAEDEKLGPMILCVDTSGSMSGTPECIAKAMALYLATQAKAQNRLCYLINFSTGITTYELTGSDGLSSLVEFLSQSFHGGTDAAPALKHALRTMTQSGYKKADLLVISDFIMSELPSEIQATIEKQRMSGNRFNSLVIGDCFMSERLRTCFDQEWVFNPSSSKIHELIHFNQDMDSHSLKIN
ncbi:VWA domain-containing protein [Amphritea sp.]|uniref:VWA domain-containing protein n=1 Tax=Amphritea sp. TaxID=1872502 RepID=UPI003A92929E